MTMHNMADKPSTKTVGDVMVRNVLVCGGNETIKVAVDKMAEMNVGSIVIIGSHMEVVGIFSERDLLTRTISANIDPNSTEISEVMTKSPQCVEGSMNVTDAFFLMQRNGFRHLPVVNKEKLVGVVSVRDVDNALWDDITLVIDEFQSALSKNLDDIKGNEEIGQEVRRLLKKYPKYGKEKLSGGKNILERMIKEEKKKKKK